MSYVRFNISDASKTISGDMHGAMTDPLIATLTAEPETIEEFQTAFTRFIEIESDWGPFRNFKDHEDLEPYDAGIVAIDLRSRVVGYETTYSIPSSSGSVKVPSKFADDDDDIYVPYRLPDDWIFVESIPLFEGTRLSRRKVREKNFPFDARPFLFGRPLTKFIAESVAAAEDLDAEFLVSDLHAQWLMTPRNELRARTPREILLAKQDFISFDLHSRSTQWSFTKVCPAPLETTSFAYENAGFGIHEAVIYYEMIRFLFYECIDLRKNTGECDIEKLVSILKEKRDAWLRTSDREFYGWPPLWIIDHERRRLNITLSAQESIVDENCPCCIALAEDFDTPMFWFLDGCNMDDRFEFSFYKTKEEWEEEQRRYEEWSKEYSETQAQKLEATREEDPF